MMGVERTSYRETARTNGWTLPPHPLQVVAYVVIIYFMVVYFTTLVPHLPTEWQPPGYIINGLAALAHIIVHLTATSINPADPNVLRKRFNNKLPMLDRTKHKHVIVDQHCYICDVDVSSRSKHCSSCNKCVSEFDHHCKWLNNCVGERNYRWFLATLATGIVAALMVVCVCFTEFIGYFTDQGDGLILQPYRDLLSQGENGTEAVFRILHQPVPRQGWLALVGITSLLALTAVALLIHLLCFHIYLIHKGITTYDYIVNQRATESDSERNANQNKPDVKPKKGNRITPTHPGDTQKKMLRNKSPLRRSVSAERKMEEGEVPPPFAGPIHREGDFVHHKQKGGGDVDTSPVKKLKKKKKSKDFSDGAKKQVISTVDNPQMYHSPKSSKRLRQQELIDSENLPSYRSESGDSLTDVTPYTISTSAGSRQKGAKARPLPPRKTGGSPAVQTQQGDARPGARNGAQEPEFYVHYSSQASLLSGSASSMGSQKKKRKKSKAKVPLEEEVEEDEDIGSQGDLNTTTMFEVNPSAQFNQDGTLNYSNGFGSLPLTPIPKRTIPSRAEVPPLDLSVLRASQESSLSYQPYSATQRSTDTFRASERFPQSNGRLKAVPEGGMDTEV